MWNQNKSILTVFLISFISALLFTISLFYSNDPKSFYFLHDEILFLSYDEVFRSSFVQSSRDFGSVNVTSIVVTFFDRVYYFIGYALGGTIHVLQPVLYFLKFFLLLFIPYLGFRKIQRRFEIEVNPVYLFLISCWFSLNTYTVIFWHANAFSLTVLIAYILCPLLFHYFYQSLFGASRIQDKILFCFLLFMQSFALYVLAPFLFFLGIVFLFMFIKSNKKVIVLKNVLFVSLFYLPFLSLLSAVLGEMLFSQEVTVNSVGGEMYLSLQGGFLYPLLMWFSWGIYTEWSPRSVFTFNEFFRSFPYLFSTFIIYGLIIFQLIRNKMNYLLLVLLFSFLVFIFFIKGAQPPLGGIFEYLVHNFAPFRVFRSPDSKFSAIIIFILSMLLLFVKGVGKDRIKTHLKAEILISVLLAIVILVQSWPLISGVAIRGVTTKTSSDRLIAIPESLWKLTSIINDSSQYGYVVPIPPHDFANFNLGNGETHAGQDLLPKISKLPFTYISDYSGMTKQSYELLVSALASGDSKSLGQFPIRFILIRKDVVGIEHYAQMIEPIRSTYDLYYSDNVYELYGFPDSVQILEGAQNYEILSPVVYKVWNVSQNLILNQNFNQQWRIYPGFDTSQFSVIKDLTFLFQKPLEINHSVINGYANQWDFKAIDGNKEYYIVFQGHIYFLTVIAISITYATLLLVVLLLITSYENFKK